MSHMIVGCVEAASSALAAEIDAQIGKRQAYPAMPIRASLVALFCGMLAVQPSRTWAEVSLETLKSLHPYAALTMTDDSNLLSTRDPESDRYLTLEAGFDAELRLSRQRLAIEARVFHNSYDRFDQLDYTGGDALVNWKWLYGRLWEGNLGYGFERDLRQFANELIPSKNLIDRHKVFGNANRWLTTRWRLGGQADWTDISFSENDSLNKTILGLGAGLDYVSKGRNEVGVAAAYAGARYPNLTDNDYEDVSIGPALKWQLTPKTRLKAGVAYKTRSFDFLSSRDFGGFVGRVTATWKPAGKTSIKTSIWRDLSNLNDEVGDYAIVDGATLEPIWNITTKTSLRAIASYEKRDFQRVLPEAGLVQIDPGDRVDKVSAFGLRLEWSARRNISLSAEYGAESRDSTSEIRNYHEHYLQFSFRAGL